MIQLTSWTEPSIRRVSSSRVDLLWAISPIRQQHIRWQIWHSKLLVDQICADPVWPPTPESVVLQTLLQLTCMWNANQFCPSQLFPVQRVWCRTKSLWSLDSPCIVCTAHPDAGSHDRVDHKRPAWEFVCTATWWYSCMYDTHVSYSYIQLT